MPVCAQNIDLARRSGSAPPGIAAATVSSTTSPTTARSSALAGPAQKLVGRWQGGTLRDGNAFITEFADDGTYRQSWLASPLHESGNWVMPSDTVVEMWTTGADAINQKHKRWRVVFEKDQVTLMPMASDDTDLPGAKPLILQHPH